MSMGTRYVVGIDTGTGGCKVTFLASEGSIAAEAYEAYPSHYEHPRWVEQDPDNWVTAAFTGVRRCLRELPDGAGARVDAIAFSAPHHTAVLLDEDDRPVRRAILWNDQRSDVESVELMRHHGELIERVTRNAAAPTWTLPQLAWLCRHRPEEYARTRSLLFMKDYVRWCFTGKKATDWIDAGGSLFFDIVERRWAPELLQLIHLDPRVLPEVVAPTARVGEVTPEAASRSGIAAGTPVFAGSADTAAESFGSGGIGEGDVTVKLATAGNVQRISSAPACSTRVISYEHPVSGLYYLNSATNFAAASFRWFRETFYSAETANTNVDAVHDKLNREIAEVAPGSGGLLFHPYLNGERSPHWDARLRGSFTGLTSRHDRRHLARAVMEGVAFSVREASDVYDAPLPDRLRLIGGGAKSPVWRQIVADVFGATVEVPASSEASFGTCLLAAIGAEWFPDERSAVAATQRMVAAVDPRPSAIARYAELYAIYREIVGELTPSLHKLSRFAEETARQSDD